MSAPAIAWAPPQEEARILETENNIPNIDAWQVVFSKFCFLLVSHSTCPILWYCYFFLFIPLKKIFFSPEHHTKVDHKYPNDLFSLVVPMIKISNKISFHKLHIVRPIYLHIIHGQLVKNVGSRLLIFARWDDGFANERFWRLCRATLL